MPKTMKRLLQIAAACIAIGFLVMFSGFFAPSLIDGGERWVDTLFIIGGGFSSVGALAAVSASIALVIKLLRD